MFRYAEFFSVYKEKALELVLGGLAFSSSDEIGFDEALFSESRLTA